MTNAKPRSIAANLSKSILPIFLLAGLALFFLFGGHEFLLFSRLVKNYASLKAYVDGQLGKALLVFGFAYILTVALSLPIASLLTVIGGALFGWISAAVIISAATIGATIVFVAARTFLNEFFAKHTSGFMAEFRAGFQKNSFSYLLALRLIPAAPFWIVNIIPALLGMRLSHYVLATLIGITPGTLIYVWVARSFDSLLSHGQSPNLSELSEPKIIVPLVALGLLSLLPALRKQLQVRQQISDLNKDHHDTQNEENNG